MNNCIQKLLDRLPQVAQDDPFNAYLISEAQKEFVQNVRDAYIEGHLAEEMDPDGYVKENFGRL